MTYARRSPASHGGGVLVLIHLLGGLVAHTLDHLASLRLSGAGGEEQVSQGQGMVLHTAVRSLAESFSRTKKMAKRM
ncbi:hypothetical protein EYF80_049229 [Liparis tanakae]|uniref:Uncharacterized protein n=1 Tax=Liparis tanakae TaxID=230148 RepID=A0A4Z2FIJ1_9TELE|nr:hypothetical protein EYF80_049229 [Liparis tanakae]